MIKQDEDLKRLANELGGKRWTWWDSCSFRRLTFIGRNEQDGGALTGAVQSDGHADVRMAPGVRAFIEAVSPAAIVDIISRLEAAERDAENYRWLRAQHWSEADIFVIAGSKSQVRSGTDCPSGNRLDEIIASARAKECP